MSQLSPALNAHVKIKTVPTNPGEPNLAILSENALSMSASDDKNQHNVTLYALFNVTSEAVRIAQQPPRAP
jgi:hypothetical protein